MILMCANSGCGADAETIWLGFALCEECTLIAYELPSDLIDCAFITAISQVTEMMDRAERFGEEANLSLYKYVDRWRNGERPKDIYPRTEAVAE